MLNLIKMDLFRLLRSKTLRVGLIAAAIVAASCLLLSLGLLEIIKATSGGSDPSAAAEMAILFPCLAFLAGASWGDIVFYGVGSFSLFIGCMITASFIGSEQSCGYVKNIAGQIPHKGFLAISKFVATSVAMALVLLVYLAVCAPLTSLLFSSYITNGLAIGELIGAFALRLLLFIAVNAVIVFLCTLTKSHAAAMVTGAIFGIGVTAIVYFAITSVLGMLKIKFDVANLMPDGVNGMLNCSNLVEILPKALIVSLVFIVGFVTGTYLLTEKRDVR
jgi:hypothetical protein